MKHSNTPTILFVYNAEHGIFNLLTDIAKKSFKGAGTCSLCDLTHDPLSVKTEWREFIESLPVPTEFAYKDIFQKEYPEHAATPLPGVFLKENDALTQIITADTINTTEDLSALMKKIRNVLPDHE